MEDRVLIGTELKYKVEIEASGFSMDENDFTVEVRRGTKSKLFEKPDMIIHETESGNEYYVAFDTSELGTGKYDFITTAYVPDDDFEDGLRTEVDKQTLAIVNKL